jgi:allophanate hydrolase subunit 2
MRLDGEPLRRTDKRELPSEGMVRGAIQVPPGGEPVVFLADHPVTGGYPVVAVVVDADVDRAAQIRPGQSVRFRIVESP